MHGQQNIKFPTDFENKNPKTIKFHENPSSVSWVAPYGQADRQTDRHDETNSRLSQFCERA
jgi:hypothetical protein